MFLYIGQDLNCSGRASEFYKKLVARRSLLHAELMKVNELYLDVVQFKL